MDKNQFSFSIPDFLHRALLKESMDRCLPARELICRAIALELGIESELNKNLKKRA